MKYKKFIIENYRAIEGPLIIDLTNTRLMPIVGINECGKTTILKAIYCFDEINDNNYEGKHLQVLENLYNTKLNENHTITAVISTTNKELSESLFQAAEKLNNPSFTADNVTSLDLDIEEFEISRNLNNKKYSVSILNDYQEDIQDFIAKYLIRNKLPYILYNDDFNDRPPSIINIPNTSAEGDEWFHIYERVFLEAGQNLIDVLNIPNSQKMKTILKSVEQNLNKNLTDSWNKFKLSKTLGNINLSLSLHAEARTLEISIEEQINKGDFYFTIEDRSKGFIWYYNFIMKTKYNPKSTEEDINNIFLLDEPGSYLHFSAQDQLCEKIREISNKNAIVIYCTHSHHMLNLNYIPLNTMYIVEKPNTKIKLCRATEVKTKTTKINALQPIYEAINIPLFDRYFADDLILVVEGIYDRYAIELFGNIKKEIKIFASTSRTDIIKDIPYFILYEKKYVALWDNDVPGINSLKLAAKNFGPIECEKFKKLPPISSDGDRRMEEMFMNDDIKKIASLLKLPADSSYETVLATLYAASSSIKKKALNVISDDTKESFEKLNKIIENTFKRNYDV